MALTKVRGAGVDTSLSFTGDLTFDASGDINLDADGGDVFIKDGGTTVCKISTVVGDGDVTFESPISNGDIFFKGNDGGSAITPVTIDMSLGGRVGINHGGTSGNPNYPLHINADLTGFVVGVFNDGNHTDRQGIIVQCGKDNAAGTNVPISFYDGDGSEQGNISFTSGTVSYNAFSASHYCIIPNADNNSSSQDNAYPYGTLLETISIAYTQKDGSNTERGILYNVQKTQSANSKKVLGAYCSSMNGGSQNHTNMHQVYVLGDGHILCNNAGGNISVGDGICSSSTAGIGQKATANPSMIIGTAQQDVTFSGSETKLVAVQYGLQQFIPWE